MNLMLNFLNLLVDLVLIVVVIRVRGALSCFLEESLEENERDVEHLKFAVKMLELRFDNMMSNEINKKGD